MNSLPRKKIGWFRKQLGKIGKRYLRKKYKKMDLYVLSLMELEVMKKYSDLLGNQKSGLEELNRQFIQGANDIFFNLMNYIKIFFSKSLEDILYIYDVAMYIILGNDYKEFFGKPRLFKAEETEDGIPKIVTRINKCVMCASVEEGDIQLQELGDKGFGEILGNAITALVQLVQDYVENDYSIVLKETKCFLRGDKYGEFTMYFYPRPKEEEIDM